MNPLDWYVRTIENDSCEDLIEMQNTAQKRQNEPDDDEKTVHPATPVGGPQSGFSSLGAGGGGSFISTKRDVELVASGFEIIAAWDISLVGLGTNNSTVCDDCHGIDISQNNIEIRSISGSVSINGESAAAPLISGKHNDGVRLSSTSATLIRGNAVNIVGFAHNARDGQSRGVELLSGSVIQIDSAGQVNIQGTAGNGTDTDNLGANVGLFILSENFFGIDNATSVLLEGFGGASDGRGDNVGVSVTSRTGHLRASDVVVTGVGGASRWNGGNHGTFLQFTNGFNWDSSATAIYGMS